MKEFKTKLEQRLDAHLSKALAIQPFSEGNLAPNLLVEGETGTGKTEIITKWAKENGVNLFSINMVVFVEATQKKVNMLYGGEECICDLSKPKTVLFLDNYDLGTEKSRSFFSSLVERHVLPTANGGVFLLNILFAIATAWHIPELHIFVESPLADGVYSRAALQDLSRRGCCTGFEEWQSY